MGALPTENELLWPSFRGPSELAEIERTPLSARGLPASTYELVTRAANLWGDRPALSVLPDAESFRTPFVRTFAELEADVHRAAAVLVELGVRRGEPVAVVSLNCAEMVPLLLGAAARRSSSRRYPTSTPTCGHRRARSRRTPAPERWLRCGPPQRPTLRLRWSRSTAPTLPTSQNGCRKLTTRSCRY